MSITRNCLIGFAIGDAMGVPIEFEKRERLVKKPVTSMLGYGSYDVPEGTWSDDTSMTLATMDSIIELGEINYNDIADKFCAWINNAKYTATNEVFDIGTTTKFALMRYWNDKVDAIKCGGSGINENGNGSLMRMLPIALYCSYQKLEEDEIYDIVKNISSITHSHEISIMGCYIYVLYMINLLNGNDKLESYSIIKKVNYSKYFSDNTINEYNRLLKTNIHECHIDDISSSGYVRNTLEAVIWVILNTNSYSEAIIGAINLGEDTDTIGAITGSIAGLLYGYESIPKKWINKMKKIDYLEEISRKYGGIFLS